MGERIGHPFMAQGSVAPGARSAIWRAEDWMKHPIIMYRCNRLEAINWASHWAVDKPQLRIEMLG